MPPDLVWLVTRGGPGRAMIVSVVRDKHPVKEAPRVWRIARKVVGALLTVTQVLRIISMLTNSGHLTILETALTAFLRSVLCLMRRMM